MFKMISEVVKISPFLNEWKGKNSSKVITSNTKVQAYFGQGTDSPINVVLIKQLKLYDKPTYEQLIKKGVMIEYQGMNMIFTKEGSAIRGTVYAGNSIKAGEVLITDDEITEESKATNYDAYHVFQSFMGEDE